jgi:transcriptional regulator of acetoin/glycerol metabolism
MASASPASLGVADADLLGSFACSVLDSVAQVVLVFEAGGRLVYANHAARGLLGSGTAFARAGTGRSDLLPRLAAWGPTVRSVRVGEQKVADVVVLSPDQGRETLDERERRAIIETLSRTGGRLAAAARELGISRTTLWRRLRRYGIPDRRGELAVML